MSFRKELKKTRNIVILILFVIAGTRAVTIQHNMHLHPDESVFYSAADSLKSYLAGSSEKYEEEKEYPEGTIVLQLPFHILGSLLRKTTDIDIPARVLGRIASVAYFTAGTVLGCIVLYRFFSKSILVTVSYGLIMAFSIIHIEQSRYGTGDALSFFLTMMIVLCTAEAQIRKRQSLLFLAYFLSGLLAAVKYPLLLFATIPISVTFKENLPVRIKRFLVGILFVLFGFLLFSPKVIADPAYIQKALSREYYMYVSGGNVCEVGGVWNHLASLSIYGMLYSGIPFALILYVRGVLLFAKQQQNDMLFLFGYMLPAVMLVFFVYNLFSSTLFFRTYYPFFCLGDLYAAYYTGEKLLDYKRRAFLTILLLLMLIRGGFYTVCLSEKNGDDRLIGLVNRTVNDQLEETTLLIPGYFISYEYSAYDIAHYERLEDDYVCNSEELRVAPGELIITGTEEFSRCNHYLFPVKENNSVRRHANNLIRNWDQFKEVNKEYLAGQIYPNYYYYLFGYWLKGSTGTDYEFPSNRVYYLTEP